MILMIKNKTTNHSFVKIVLFWRGWSIFIHFKNFIKCLLRAGPIPVKQLCRLLEEVRKTSYAEGLLLPGHPVCLRHVWENSPRRHLFALSLIFSSRSLVLWTKFILKSAAKEHQISWRTPLTHSCIGWDGGQSFWPSTQESWPSRGALPLQITACYPEGPQPILLSISSPQ